MVNLSEDEVGFIAVHFVNAELNSEMEEVTQITKIFQEIINPGSISEALNENGPPAAMIAITEQLPFGTIIGFLFIVATIIFVLTTTDSMSLTISMAITGSSYPSKALRVFWALLMGAVAVLLLTIGEDSVNSLQSFIVVTAVPVSFLICTTFTTASH